MYKSKNIQAKENLRSYLNGKCFDKYLDEASKKLTTDIKEAKIRCRLCGFLYKERPFICFCRSNCFLAEINKGEIND